MGTRRAFDRYDQGRRGRINHLFGIAHWLVGFVVDRGFNRDVFVGHQGNPDVAKAFGKYVLGGNIMHMHVGSRVRNQGSQHLVAGYTALRFGIEGIGALDRLNASIFITHPGTHRLVRCINGFSQLERPVSRLAFFY